MRQRTIEAIKDILILEMNHWAFLPIFITLTCVTEQFTGDGKWDFLLWTLCGLFPVGFYFLRRRAQRFLPFVITHFLLAIPALLIPARTPLSKGAGIAIVTVYLIQSFHLRLKNNLISSFLHPAVIIVVAALCVFLQHYLKIVSWDSTILLGLAGVLMLYFIIYYMEHYLEFLSFNESSTGYLPAAEMFRSGMGFVLFYTLAGTFLLLLSTNVAWLETILDILKRGVITVLRFLFSLFPDPEPPDILPREESIPQDSPNSMILPEGGEGSPFWKILEIVVMLVLACGLLYLLFRLFLWLVQFIRSRFSAGFSIREQHFEDIQDQREKCDPVKKSTGTKKSGFFQAFSPVERIRRRYRKKVISCKADISPDLDDLSLLGLYTARECGEKLKAMEMASIYEKVRYTEEPATEEMVRDMRAACK